LGLVTDNAVSSVREAESILTGQKPPPQGSNPI
jgi:hypothetical protein